jgi:hypothetical protein
MYETNFGKWFLFMNTARFRRWLFNFTWNVFHSWHLHVNASVQTGAATYCAVASLSLLRRLKSTLTQREIEQLYRWCINRLDVESSNQANTSADCTFPFWNLAVILVCTAVRNFRKYGRITENALRGFTCPLSYETNILAFRNILC